MGTHARRSCEGCALRSSSGFVPLRRGFAETATEYLTKHHQQAPELGFAYDALEPVFSATSMFNHHRRHCDHVKELNRAISAFAVANEKGNLDGVIASQGPIQLNGGAHVNHSIFWNTLDPKDGLGSPSEELAAEITLTFGSQDKLREQLLDVGGSIQGPGWVWLCLCPETSAVQLATTVVEEPLFPTKRIPL